MNRFKGFQIPFISMSEQGTLSQKTGLWGRMRPLFVERLAPCQENCPAGMQISKALGYLREKNFEEAALCIREENPFLRITGRVCFHPCEANCNRKNFDQAVSIRSLERFLSDYPIAEPRRTELNGKRVAVIGSGPAGLSCSYYLALLGYRVTLFEAEKELGGMLRFGIPKYRLPNAILDRQIKDVLSLGIELVTGKKIGRDLLLEELDQNYDAIFIATGAWKSLKMSIPGEESPNVIPALNFLKEASQEARPVLGKRVIVVGGGNCALDAARTSLRMGSQVTVIYRRTRREMPAFSEEIEEAEEERIQIVYLTSPIQILTKNGKIQIECTKNFPNQPGEDGRSVPVAIRGSNHFLETDAVLIAVGESSDFSFLPTGAKMKERRIEIGDKTLRKVFLGGDLLPRQKSVIHAIQSGKEGAIMIDEYLKHEGKIEQIRWTSMSAYRKNELEAAKPTVKYEDLNTSYFEHQERVQEVKLPPGERKTEFTEVAQTVSPNSAVQEAGRCFQCGLCTICKNCDIFCPDFVVSIGEKVTIDYDHCKGCCICVQECPRGAIIAEVKT